MKRYLIAACVAALAFTGCKTTEANYKAAYEAAKQKNEETRGIEGTVYEKIRNEAIESRLIVKNDSIPMSTVQVKIARQTASPDSVKRYSLVVNQFKQVFNATSQMNRLRSEGYPEAFLLETAEPLYYVVASSFDSPEEASAAYKKIIADKSVTMKAPFPWILRPARFPLE